MSRWWKRVDHRWLSERFKGAHEEEVIVETWQGQEGAKAGGRWLKCGFSWKLFVFYFSFFKRTHVNHVSSICVSPMCHVSATCHLTFYHMFATYMPCVCLIFHIFNQVCRTTTCILESKLFKKSGCVSMVLSFYCNFNRR